MLGNVALKFKSLYLDNRRDEKAAPRSTGEFPGKDRGARETLRGSEARSWYQSQDLKIRI